MLSHEPIEWPDEVEVLVDRLESESAKRALTSEERAFMLFWRGARALLCRGLEKAGAEFTLSALGYNLTRAMDVLGVAGLIKLIKESSKRPRAAQGTGGESKKAANAKRKAVGQPGTSQADFFATEPNWLGLPFRWRGCL